MQSVVNRHADEEKLSPYTIILTAVNLLISNRTAHQPVSHLVGRDGRACLTSGATKEREVRLYFGTV